MRYIVSVSKKTPQRPMSAQPTYQKSVEEELELTSRVSSSRVVSSSRENKLGGSGLLTLSAADSRSNKESQNNKTGFRSPKTNNYLHLAPMNAG